MGLNAYIRVQEKEYSTSGSYRIATAKVYAYIVDDFDQPTDGNGATINYSIKENGLLTGSGTASAMGQQVLLFDGVVERDLDNDDGTFSLAYTKVYYLDSIIAIQNPPPPVNSCDLVINSVSVLKPESAPGAADGQISINASSSYLPLQYSLDGVHFQSSNTFTGLGSGLKTVTVKDANTIGCVETHAVTVPVLSSLLVKDPSVNINGNISRWNAAFNPIVFTYQRRDFSVTSVTYDSPTTIQVTVNANLSSLVEGDSIYINAGPYAGVFEIVDLTQNSFMIKTPFTVVQSTGFVNINKLMPYYRLLTYITYSDVKTGAVSTITSVNRPDNTGLIKADLSNFLQSLLTVKDDSNYSQANFKDNNLSASYQISYAEQWDDPNATNVNSPPVTSNVINIAEPYYVVYAAKQLGERYGGNLAAYVPFANGQPAARWITDFAEPAYSNSYPFDISFIYSENLIGLNIYCELTMLDINRNPLAGSVQDITLLNEDNTWLLNQDGARLLIARQNPTDSILPERLGLNRLLVDTDFPAEARYFNIALKYNDGTAVHTVTQTQTIRIDDAIDEQSVYLRWIGLSAHGITTALFTIRRLRLTCKTPPSLKTT